MSFERLQNLNGKVAVITGDGQIAKATALRLSQQGARIFILARTDLEKNQAELDGLPHAHLGHRAIFADVLKTDTLRSAVDQVKRCDILVNTVGRSRALKAADLRGHTDEIFDEILLTNVRGTFAVIREFSEFLMASRDGLVVNISSAAGLSANPNCLAYSASKAAVDSMTKSLGKALAPWVRVISIAPTRLEGGPTSGVIQEPAFLKKRNQEHADKSPLKRIGWADDIANTVEAYAMIIRYATATTVVVDAGITA